MIKVKIKLLEGGIIPTKGTKGAAAFDCYARTDMVVKNQAVLVPLGFAIEIPEGYHAEIIPRSSIGLKTPLRAPHSVGIIDSDFRGEVCAEYECKGMLRVALIGGTYIAPDTYEIKAGDRICQMVIKRNEDVELVTAGELSETERGESGWGSTGK